MRTIPDLQLLDRLFRAAGGWRYVDDDRAVWNVSDAVRGPDGLLRSVRAGEAWSSYLEAPPVYRYFVRRSIRDWRDVLAVRRYRFPAVGPCECHLFTFAVIDQQFRESIERPVKASAF